MFLYRKNVILVPSDYDGISLTKGLLSFDCYDTKTKCTLHCYNLYNDRPLTLGIAVGNNLHKIKIDTGKTKNLSFEIGNVIKNKDEISCVLLDVRERRYYILLWGSTQMSSGWKTTIQMMLDDEISPIKRPDMVEQTAEKFEKDEFENFDNETNIEKLPFCESDLFEKNIVKSESEEVYTYDDKNLDDFIDKVIDMTEERENQYSPKIDTDSLSFYERINPQIERMFALNKQENVLNEIIPNSKFCKVNFDDGTGYYVFGIIYDDGKPKYLCYGIPAQKNSEPPKELANLYQWLPIDASDDNGDGFYMMYQDALTGKNISVEVV